MCTEFLNFNDRKVSIRPLPPFLPGQLDWQQNPSESHGGGMRETPLRSGALELVFEKCYYYYLPVRDGLNIAFEGK